MKEHERLVADAIEKRHERISKKLNTPPLPEIRLVQNVR